MIEPLRTELEFDTNTKAGRKIPNGTYECPPSVSERTREFLAQLKTHQCRHPFPSNSISQESFHYGWKCMKERTSVGISDIHFGQMKSCTKDPFLTDFESSLANVPYSTGYSSPNWKVGVSVMINKSSKVDLVTG